MLDLEVIHDPAAATVALEPIRSRLLAELSQPASASTVAARIGLSRQKATYHAALAARAVQEASDLVRLARDADKHLATLSIDTEIRFRSAAERAAFTTELTRTVTGLVSKYHDESSPGGRSHRLIVAAHPTPLKSTVKEQS